MSKQKKSWVVHTLSIRFPCLMSNGILCSVILLSLRFTGQLGQPHFQSSSVGICGGQCLFSPFWCSDSLFQKLSSDAGNGLLWIHSVKGHHHKSKWNQLHNCLGVIKPYSYWNSVFVFAAASIKSSYQFVLCFRAIYFAAYSKSKEMFNGVFVPNSGAVHMSSAGVAGEQQNYYYFWIGKLCLPCRENNTF